MLSLTIISLGILCFFTNIRTVYSSDYFWHIKVGQWILEHHKIPTTDIFSWYGKKMNLEFISHEWLSDIMMFLLGKNGLLILLPIISMTLFFFIYKYLNIKKEKVIWNNIIKIGYALLAILTINGMEMRPGIFSLILFNCFLYILWNKKNLYWIPLIQLLWVNIHGGSSSLIPLLLIIEIGIDIIENKTWKNQITQQKIKILVFSILISLINPYTYKILLYPYKNMKDTTMINFITEWHSPSFHNIIGIFNALILFLPPFLLLFTKKKKEMKDILLLSLFLFMSLRSTRFILHYIFIGSYIIGKYTNLKISFKTKRKIIINQKVIKITIIILTILLSIGIINQNKKELNKYPSYSNKLIKELIKINPKRMYNDYNNGGYLTTKLYNKKPDIFINGICDIYSSNILPDYNNLYHIITPEKIIKKYDFDAFIIPRKTPLEYYLKERQDYQIIYQDKTGILFKKKD